MSEVFVSQPSGGLLGYATYAECISACLAEIARLKATLVTARTKEADAMREAALDACSSVRIEFEARAMQAVTGAAKLHAQSVSEGATRVTALLRALPILPAHEGKGGVMDKINAPFTPEQVAGLHQYQFGPWAHPFTREPKNAPLRMHPFTCPNRGDHPMIAGDKGILVPTMRGWICQCCDYTQDWAHKFMAGTPP